MSTSADGRDEISDDMAAALWAQEVEPVVQLITLESDQLAEPIRVCDHPGGLVSRGESFAYLPFSLQWAPASRDAPFGEGRLTIANVDSRIEEACEAAEAPPQLTLEIVRASAPDTVERAIVGAEIASAEGNEIEASAVIRPKDFGLEPACAAVYGVGRTSGLF